MPLVGWSVVIVHVSSAKGLNSLAGVVGASSSHLRLHVPGGFNDAAVGHGVCLASPVTAAAAPAAPLCFYMYGYSIYISSPRFSCCFLCRAAKFFATIHPLFGSKTL
jgi:hypothetical protein